MRHTIHVASPNPRRCLPPPELHKNQHTSFKPNLLATYFFMAIFFSSLPAFVAPSLAQNHFVSYFLSADFFLLSLSLSVEMRHRQITAFILLACVHTFRFLSARDHPTRLHAFLWLFFFSPALPALLFGSTDAANVKNEHESWMLLLWTCGATQPFCIPLPFAIVRCFFDGDSAWLSVKTLTFCRHAFKFAFVLYVTHELDMANTVGPSMRTHRTFKWK